MIKAVFFDYDGVLTTDKTGSLTTTRYLSRVTGVELPVVKAAFSPFNIALTLGRTTHAQIWPELCRSMGKELSINMLYEAFESTPMNLEMFCLARRLKKSYSVGIITDNKKDRIDHLRQRQGLASIFNPIIVSAEIGADKSGMEIFRHALSLAGVHAEEAVFVDNSRDNLAAPNAMGIKTVFHDDEKNDIEVLSRCLRSVGVEPGVKA